MRCELCDKKIKEGIFGLFVKDHEKGVRSAVLSYMGRNPWVHKICYFRLYQEIINKTGHWKIIKTKVRKVLRDMFIDDYKMMKELGDIQLNEQSQKETKK